MTLHQPIPQVPLSQPAPTDDHRELFPLSGYRGAAGMRRISVVTEVQSIAKNLWSWRPVKGADTLAGAIDESLRHSQPSHDIRLAIDEYFSAYAPLKTDVRAMDTDARRALMAQIIADAREDQVKYRKRMQRIGGLQ